MPDEGAMLIELLAIERIKQLKARYFRLMDQRAWDEWPAVLTEDCVMTLLGTPPVVLAGRVVIVASARRNLDPRVGMHLGHMPEIELTGERTAVGAWSLFACSTPKSTGVAVTAPGMMSFGTYRDQYRLEADGAWRIASTTLSTVLRVMGDAPAGVDVLGPADGTVVSRL